MDDEEFNLGKKQIEGLYKANFSKDDICGLAYFLNRFAYEQYYTSNGLEIFAGFKSTLIKLLRELYNRDSRQKYTPTLDFWLIPEINSEKYSNYSIGKGNDPLTLYNIVQELPQTVKFERRIRKYRDLIEYDYKYQDRNPFPMDEDQK